MASTLDLASLAGASYNDNRAAINRFPVPQGWALYSSVPSDLQTGFEARTFQSGSEIVISYAGTDFSTPNPLAPDMRANNALGTGAWSPQLLQAAEYYLQVKAANPSVPVTLTGHSLGGGLAALVGVFFGVPSVTFDQAPFAASASNLSTNAATLRAQLAARLNTDGTRQYSDAVLAPLTDYLVLRYGNIFIPRASLVETIRVEGELLDGGIGGNVSIGNPATVISHGTGAGQIDLHSQALLTAFLQSTASATANGDASKSLSEVSKKLPDLLKLFFDSKLFSYSTAASSPDRNFLDHLVRHESGVQGSFAADAMVTRFTADLWKLAQPGGLTMTDGNAGMFGSATSNLSKALIAFAMQKYYEETAASAGYNKALFSDVTGGIRLDMADVSTKFATAFANHIRLNLADAKGFALYFTNYLKDSGFSEAERSLILSQLPNMRDWYVQAGVGGLATTDNLNRGAFMLGGGGNDALVGGTRADLLVGNLGDDVLMGSTGNDMLLGGKGNDTYVFQRGDGFDTILDSDGLGSIVYDGATLTGGAQYGDNRTYRSADGKHLYVRVDTNTLLIDGNIRVQAYQPGQLNIALSGPSASGTPVVQTNQITLPELSAGEKILSPTPQATVFTRWHLGNPYDDGTYQRVYEHNTRPGYYLYGNVTNPDYHPVIGSRGDPIYASVARLGFLTAASDRLVGSAGDDRIADWSGMGALGDLIEAGAGHGTYTKGARTCYTKPSCLRDILLVWRHKRHNKFTGKKAILRTQEVIGGAL
jgi:RTX calcium-binding nonapeptide repeat (4 copies)/Lipase (class 3)